MYENDRETTCEILENLLQMHKEIDEEIEQTENELADMIDDLVADEFDLKGLQELQKLLRGE